MDPATPPWGSLSNGHAPALIDRATLNFRDMRKANALLSLASRRTINPQSGNIARVLDFRDA